MTHPGNISIVNTFSLFYIKGLTLQSSQAVNNAKRLGWPLKDLGGDVYLTQAPGGYPFYLVDKEHPSTGESDGSVTCQYYTFSIVIPNLMLKCKQVLVGLQSVSNLPVTFDRLLPDPVQKVCLGVSDLQRSTHYWTTLLGMKLMERNEEKKTVLLGFSETQVRKMCNFLCMWCFCLFF